MPGQPIASQRSAEKGTSSCSQGYKTSPSQASESASQLQSVRLLPCNGQLCTDAPCLIFAWVVSYPGLNYDVLQHYETGLFFFWGGGGGGGGGVLELLRMIL